MNAFEHGTRKVIPAVLVYVRSGDDVLMIHRVGRDGDFHAGKWNGLGGKMEPDESPLEAARRELLEESGLDLPSAAFRALGVVQFPNFKPARAEDWVVFLFTAVVGTEARAMVADFRCTEGALHWVPACEVMNLNLWPGDRFFLPTVLKGESVVATVWYRDGVVVRGWVG
jgi:8-oxo-dGTP diphosphatase